MLLSLLSALFLLLYGAYFLRFFKGLSAGRRIAGIWYAAAAALVLTAERLPPPELDPFGVLFLMAAAFFSLRVFFRANMAQALYCGSFFALSLYSGRAVLSAVYTLALGRSAAQGLLLPETAGVILIFSSVLSAAVLSAAKRTLARPESLPGLLKNREELRYLLAEHLLLTGLFLLAGVGRLREPRQLWYAVLYLFSGVTTGALVLFSLRRAARIAALAEYETQARQLREQLEGLRLRDSACQRDAEDLRSFRHDYRDMMASVRRLILSGKSGEALRLLGEIHDAARETVLSRETYSDHVVLDAVLQDTAAVCAAKQIAFSARVPFPLKDGLADLDKVRIFTNLTRNAVEACEKLPAGARYIEITGGYNDAWLFARISNSYDGKASYDGGGQQTAKGVGASHGRGLKIVRALVEAELGGVLLLEADRTKREFRAEFSIPRRAAGPAEA